MLESTGLIRDRLTPRSPRHMPRNPLFLSTAVVRQRITRGLGAVLSLLAVGCAGDDLSGPSESLPWGGIAVSRGPAGVPRPDVIVHHVADDSASAEFTVTSTGGVFALGPHAIYFPPNSICAQGSSYGPTEWDA